MKYIIVFKYMDGKDFEIEVHPDDMHKFMDAIGKGEVYFNDARGVGVWVAIDKVRYFQVEAVDEYGKRVIGSDAPVHEHDGGAICPEMGDKEAGKGSVVRAVPGDIVDGYTTTTDGIPV